MLKKFICILSLLVALPAFCGEFEDASRAHKKIFLYMYTKDCKYCVEFEPTYEKMAQKYKKDCKFLKIDANTQYGNSLMQKISAYYVPHVVLINNERQTMQRITPKCLLNFACTKDAVEKFVD